MVADADGDRRGGATGVGQNDREAGRRQPRTLLDREHGGRSSRHAEHGAQQ